MPRRPALLRLLLAVCALALIAPVAASVPVAAAPAQPAAAPTTSPGDPTPPLAQQAKDALAKVQEIFASTPAAGTPQHPEADLTMALKDLAALVDELPPTEQKQAESFLARPTQNNCNDVRCYSGPEEPPVCTTYVCIHYVKKSTDDINGVPGEDDGPGGNWNGPDNNIPDYVDVVLDTMTHVDNFYFNADYRRPLPDGTKGGDDRRDIYLEQIGDVGYYGYCTTDDPTWSPGFHGGVYGYCVLDNDYKSSEFTANTPLENMQVTAAHEYFHAIQFGYDIGDDNWFLEATATWAEDVLYDSVNDNVFYLEYGPMKKPGVALDSFKGLFPYGAWIFFRHLSDDYPASTGGMPDIIRLMWEQADANTDANPTAPDKYSMQAVKKVLADHSTDLTTEFGEFVVGNRRPASHYSDEGEEEDYPKSPLGGSTTLTKDEPKKRYAFELDHMTSRTHRFEPGGSLTNPAWHLKVMINANDTNKGGYALVTYKPDGSGPATEIIPLDSSGRGTWVHGFVNGDIDWVEVSTVNASTRYNCNEGTIYSCRGKPRDDNADQSVIGKVYKP